MQECILGFSKEKKGFAMESEKKDAQQEKEGLKSKAICLFTSFTDTVILKSLGYLFFNYSIHINMLCFKKNKN